jgi:hypothetical protein
MDEEPSLLYKCCMDRKNIANLLGVIRSQINLNDSSAQKCVQMIHNVMNDNINRLTRLPRNPDEVTKMVRYLNEKCVSHIVEYIIKKYPDKFINKRRNPNNEKLNRELDTMGRRQNYVQNRPYSQTRKDYDEQPEDYNGSDGTGYGTINQNDGGYATAFSDNLITTLPLLDTNNRSLDRDPDRNQMRGSSRQADLNQRQDEYASRMMEYKNERDRGLGRPQKPPTPNFSLDKTDEEFQRERQSLKMRSQMDSFMPSSDQMFGNMVGNNMVGNMGGNLAGPVGMGTFGDDIYSSLLGSGAPNQMPNMNPNPNQMMNPNQMPNMNPNQMPNMNPPPMMNSNQMFNQPNQQPTLNIFGNGNPLMPMSSTNMIGQGYGGSNQVSVRQTQFNNDFERKMAEMRAIDIETNQRPAQSQSGGYDSYSTGNAQLPGMNIPGMNMPNMQMPSMQMPMNMPSMQMPMYNSQMPMYNMQIPQYS